MRRRRGPRSIISFIILWIVLASLDVLPGYVLFGLLIVAGLSIAAAYLLGKKAGEKKNQQAEKKAQVIRETIKVQPKAEAAPVEKKAYSPEVEAILKDGNRALSEMGRIYQSIKDEEVRKKINEIMRITDKITQDAIADPSDIPQIKKFMNYYLPTTIKLLNSYDRMSAQGIEGENLTKSMNSINEMLDAVIVAYKKRLDSLFANQALDIETDIDVMNQMLAREGLIGEKDFQIKQQTAN